MFSEQSLAFMARWTFLLLILFASLSTAPAQAQEAATCDRKYGAQRATQWNMSFSSQAQLWGTSDDKPLVQDFGSGLHWLRGWHSTHSFTHKTEPIVGMFSSWSGIATGVDFVFFRTARGFAVAKLHHQDGAIEDVLNQVLRFQDSRGTWVSSPLVAVETFNDSNTSSDYVWLLTNFHLIQLKKSDLGNGRYLPQTVVALPDIGDGVKGFAAVGLFPRMEGQWVIVERHRISHELRMERSFDVRSQNWYVLSLAGSWGFANILKPHRVQPGSERSVLVQNKSADPLDTRRSSSNGTELAFFLPDIFYPVTADLMSSSWWWAMEEGVAYDPKGAYEFAFQGSSRGCRWPDVGREFFMSKKYVKSSHTVETTVHFLDSAGIYQQWVYKK